MKIHTDREMKIYNIAYKLGFWAGQLAWRQYAIDDSYFIRASSIGAQIAVRRGNISLEEYRQVAESLREE